MFNPHPFADKIKRRPKIEALLVTRDNRNEVVKKIIDWLMEGMN